MSAMTDGLVLCFMFFINAKTEIELLKNNMTQSNSINIKIRGSVMKIMREDMAPKKKMMTYDGMCMIFISSAAPIRPKGSECLESIIKMILQMGAERKIKPTKLSNIYGATSSEKSFPANTPNKKAYGKNTVGSNKSFFICVPLPPSFSEQTPKKSFVRSLVSAAIEILS